MARRAEAARRRRQIQAAVGAVLALVAVIGGTWWAVKSFHTDKTSASAKPAPSASAAPSASPSAKPSLAPGQCDYGKAEKAAKDVGTPPAKDVKHAGAQSATLTLNTGELKLELDAAKAPCTVNSFTYLASKKYFDGTPCHRLVTSNIFVLQCGDPTGSGSGGPGYQFAEENLPAAGDKNYPEGVLAMANAGPGTNGSQFFIVYKGTSLPANYTIFGKVTNGLDVVKKIAEVGITTGAPGDGKPKNPVKIDKLTVG
jgi:peptidyl-prolyl cis-trans isomerase B (cyclophilin B)